VDSKAARTPALKYMRIPLAFMPKNYYQHFEKCQLVYTFVVHKTDIIMKTLSLKLDESVFMETEELLEKIKKPRNRYINEALQHYNRIQKKKIIEKRLEAESRLVRDESMKVLSEFEKLEDYDS